MSFLRTKIPTSNRYESLRKEDEGEDEEEDEGEGDEPRDQAEEFEAGEWRHKEKKKKMKPKISFLKERRPSTISAIQGQDWEELVMTVDSGASETVAPPTAGTGIQITDSKASLEGVEYEVADGNTIPNLGDKRCVIQSESGTMKLLTLQICDVRKPLLAVSKLCATGHAVVFHPEWSYIEHVATGERMTLEQRDGLYHLRTWVKAAPRMSPVFTGPAR